MSKRGLFLEDKQSFGGPQVEIFVLKPLRFPRRLPILKNKYLLLQLFDLIDVGYECALVQKEEFGGATFFMHLNRKLLVLGLQHRSPKILQKFHITVGQKIGGAGQINFALCIGGLDDITHIRNSLMDHLLITQMRIQLSTRSIQPLKVCHLRDFVHFQGVKQIRLGVFEHAAFDELVENINLLEVIIVVDMSRTDLIQKRQRQDEIMLICIFLRFNGPVYAIG